MWLHMRYKVRIADTVKACRNITGTFSSGHQSLGAIDNNQKHSPLTRVASKRNWLAHPVTNGNNAFHHHRGGEGCLWLSGGPDQSAERPDSGLIAPPPRWVIQSGRSAPQLSAKTAHPCGLQRLASRAWWGMKEFVIICIIPQRWSPGIVMSHGQSAEGVGRELLLFSFSIVNRNLTFNLSKIERSPSLLHQDGFLIVCGTTQDVGCLL